MKFDKSKTVKIIFDIGNAINQEIVKSEKSLLSLFL